MDNPPPPDPSQQRTQSPPEPLLIHRTGRRRLWLGLIGVVGAVAVVLAASQWSGTGANNVGVSSTAPVGSPPGIASGACAATISNPGGDNNYQPNAPLRPDLGSGFDITGTVRGTDCAPLPGVRVQVWLSTAMAGERANQASVITGPDGRYHISSAPVRSQFGEPNIHIAYDDADYEPVFLRNVVDEGDSGAVIDLTLAER